MFVCCSEHWLYCTTKHIVLGVSHNAVPNLPFSNANELEVTFTSLLTSLLIRIPKDKTALKKENNCLDDTY